MAAKEKPGAETAAAKVNGPETFHEAAKAFIKAAGGGFIIRHVEGPQGSIATGRTHTLPQWLAWMTYFDRKRIPHAFLDKWGLGTVPAEWPWLFDLAEVDEADAYRKMADDLIAERNQKRYRGPQTKSPLSEQEELQLRDMIR